MFIANYIDRVNIGFVNAHMKTDLGIGAAAYGLGSGLFFIGYALFEVPPNVLMQKYGARAWLTRIMGTWGVVAACMAFVSNETSVLCLCASCSAWPRQVSSRRGVLFHAVAAAE